MGRSESRSARSAHEVSRALVESVRRAAAAARGGRAAMVADGSGIARGDAEALLPLAVAVAGPSRRTEPALRAVQEPHAGAAAKAPDAHAEFPQVAARAT